jgi:hypothetical protein
MKEAPMVDVIEVLTQEREAIVATASSALERSHVPHYADAGAESAHERLELLLSLVLDSVTSRDLVPVIHHAERIAKERYEAGYDIREVQTAFNVLEEAIWARVVASVPAEHLAEALGLVGTVLGAGRDALASTYVSLATRQHVRSLDLSALFRGGR